MPAAPSRVRLQRLQASVFLKRSMADQETLAR